MCGPACTRRRVVIVGLGDAGAATAVRLASHNHLKVVGIAAVPCHYSAQELGGRLSRPSLWKQAYLNSFESYVRLDRVRIVHGIATPTSMLKRF